MVYSRTLHGAATVVFGITVASVLASGADPVVLDTPRTLRVQESQHAGTRRVKDSPAGQDKPPSRAVQPKIQRRTFGRLPDWAKQSWFIRRQMDQPWMLRGASVIDVRTGRIRQNVNIVIAGDQIRTINSQEPPPGMKVVDASDQYVIPGLFDLHAHVIPKSRFLPNAPEPAEALRLLMDAGVTTIRALPFYSESALQWAAQINSGTLIGPSIVPASSIFEKEAQRTSRGFGDPDTAAAWVRKEALLGVRWIKVYNRMDENSLRTIIETARSCGLKVCGHANEVPPHRAAALGMASIEHATSIAYSCLRDGAPKPPGTVGLIQAAWYWEHADPAKLDDLMKTFKGTQTAWVPTLVVLERIVSSGDHDMKSFDDNVIAQFRKALRMSAKLAVQLHRQGGLVGIGTDFPVDGVRPGVSVHRELELLVELGGASPAEALQMGTLSSASILACAELLGTVEAGRLAHLVVLAKNPLEDISNIRSIRHVIHDGRLYEPRSAQ